MMNDKAQIITQLRDEFDRWETLLSGLSEEQITIPHLPANLSIKDVIAHLWTWQQRSIARMDAALHDREPEFPGWPAGLNPEAEEDLDRVNAWIHETNREKPWSRVHEDWRAGFLRLIELADAAPETVLLAPGKYAWLDGAPLAIVLTSSYAHHHEEHLEPLREWLRQNRLDPD